MCVPFLHLDRAVDQVNNHHQSKVQRVIKNKFVRTMMIIIITINIFLLPLNWFSTFKTHFENVKQSSSN